VKGIFLVISISLEVVVLGWFFFLSFVVLLGFLSSLNWGIEENTHQQVLVGVFFK
jgi:hypothetical protein